MKQRMLRILAIRFAPAMVSALVMASALAIVSANPAQADPVRSAGGQTGSGFGDAVSPFSYHVKWTGSWNYVPTDTKYSDQKAPPVYKNSNRWSGVSSHSPPSGLPLYVRNVLQRRLEALAPRDVAEFWKRPPSEAPVAVPRTVVEFQYTPEGRIVQPTVLASESKSTPEAQAMAFKLIERLALTKRLPKLQGVENLTFTCAIPQAPAKRSTAEQTSASSSSSEQGRVTGKVVGTKDN